MENLIITFALVAAAMVLIDIWFKGYK